MVFGMSSSIDSRASTSTDGHLSNCRTIFSRKDESVWEDSASEDEDDDDEGDDEEDEDEMDIDEGEEEAEEVVIDKDEIEARRKEKAKVTYPLPNPFNPNLTAPFAA